MNYRILRLLLSLVGIGALAQFGLSFSDYLRNRTEVLQVVDWKGIVDTFQQSSGTSEIGHLSPSSSYRSLHATNVTGALPVDPVLGPAVAPPPRVGAEDLLVQFIQLVGGGVSCAYIAPRTQVQRENMPASGDLYWVGDQFEVEGKPGALVELLAIRLQEVELELVDGDEPPFLLTLTEEPSDPSQILVSKASYSEVMVQAPTKTRMTEPDHYELGSEDLALMGDMPEDEVFAAVKVTPQRDPATGRSRGLRIRSLKADSVFVRQGLRENDVLLAVNGIPATSQADLLRQLRTLGPTERIEIKFERAGAVRSQYYLLPRP